MDEEPDQVSAGSAASADTPRLRYGHFEVVPGLDDLPTELGRGAMATTYRASDTVLCLPVALKVISRRVAGHLAARARFLREARAAARLRHPNVASVTFYGEQDGECFYAMELVEGETLAERMQRRGPFSPAQTIEVGVQVARALAAAEAYGLVHRDLKPSNLMLVGAPEAELPLHVKVIDWGLAKAISVEDEFLGADQTRHAFVGTPAFASPEQFAHASGEQRVDIRSDTYSLGVTLWYLVCGKTPFVGDTLPAIHARQRTLPLEQLAVAKVPGYLSEVLQSMVAFDPAARPQSARELLEVLSRCQEKCADQTLAKPWRRRSKQLMAALLAVVVLGAATSAWRWRHASGTSAAPGEKFALAVLPFENLGAEKANEFFATGVQDGITNNLAHLAAFDVISAASTRDYPPGQKRDFPRIGQELGVRYLLEGDVRRQNDQIQVSVRLSDISDPDHPWSERRTWPLDKCFAIQSEMTRAVVTHLRATLSEREKALLDKPPTKDLAAYDLYLRGRDSGRVFQTVEQEHRHRLETSIPLLEQAVKRDPQFVLAYVELVNNYIHLASIDAQDGLNEAVESLLKQAKAALAQAVRIQPDAGEVHLAKASVDGLLNQDPAKTLQELDLARQAMPSNADVDLMASFLDADMGHADGSIRGLERVVRLEPRNADRRFSLALAFRTQRRYEDSDREIARVIAALPRSESLSYRMFRAIGKLEERADLAPLKAVIDSVTPEDAALPEVMTKARMIVALYSHDAAGTTNLLADIPPEGLNWGEQRLPKAWFEALAARLRHDDAAAHEAFLRARAAEARTAPTDLQSAYNLSILAMLDAGLGDNDKALSEAQSVSLSVREQSYALAPVIACQVAVAYAWTNRPDLACQTLDPWIELPAGWSLVKIPSCGDFRLNPVWDTLQGNPRFEALKARFAPKSE